MTDRRHRTRYLWLPNLGDTSNIYFIQDTNVSTDTKSAGHGQNQEKEKKTPTAELNTFLSNFFDGK